MKIIKPKFWDSEWSMISFLLSPLSLIFKALILLKNLITVSEKFNISVICVGNIYLGGTGKTPLSILINNELKKIKKNPVIIKKFYKNQEDEHKLIKKKTNLLILNQKRSRAIQDAIKKKFKVVILDDGFQDHSIKKNLNILCFNSKQLIGNGKVLPAGPLRESFNSIKRAKIIVINGDRNIMFEKKIINISKNIKIFYSKYIPSNISEFKNKNILAFAGIGNPSNFFELLERKGFNIKKRISFPDHYRYTKMELKDIISESKKNKLDVITTEKDYYRIKEYGFNNIKFLKIELQINKKKNLISQILKNL